MSSAPSPLSLSDFLTSPPPLDLASLPPSSALLARYSSHATAGGSTPGASGGTPSSNHQPEQQRLLNGNIQSKGQNDGDYLDFMLSPDAHGGSVGGGAGGGDDDGQDAGYGLHGEGMFGIHPTTDQQPPADHEQQQQQYSRHHSRQHSRSSTLGGKSQQGPYHGQQHDGPLEQQQQLPPPPLLQPDLRALLESLGASAADFDLDAASSPSSTSYPAALQLPQQLLAQQQQLLMQHQQQQQHGGGAGPSNGLLDLVPQLQGLAQLSAQQGGFGQNGNGLALLQQLLQKKQQQQQHSAGGQSPAPDVSALLSLLGLPGFGGPQQQQQQQQQQQSSYSSQGGSVQGADATGVTLAKLRELQEMQQQQTAMIQQQLNQIASFYQSNPHQQQQAGGSGSTTSTTSPSGASVQNGTHQWHPSQQPHSIGHGSGSSSGITGESPHLNSQPYGSQHGQTSKHNVRGINIGPLPTPDHSGEISAMTFSPHLMNQAGGMMSPVYLPGTSYNAGGRPSGTAHWRNTGEAYDRDGNLLMTPLISPAMTAISHPTPGSTFQPLNPALAHPSGGGDFFSPLTSPALGPSQFERGMNLHHHPYIGTMSPHLLAQRSTPNSPLINGSIGPSGSSKPRSSASRAARGPGSTALDGLNGGKASTSRSKTRPSPIIKPVVGSGQPRRRSTIHGPSGISSGGGGSSAVGSPKTVMTPPGGQDGPQPLSTTHVLFQGLPASAIPMEVSHSHGSIQQSVSPASSAASGPALFLPTGSGHVLGHSKSASQHTFASDSSPSPIDFASLQMPPPPHPSQKAEALQPQPPSQVAPQTPATFLNLGRPAADQRAIYSEGNTVSPGIVVDTTAAGDNASASGSNAASSSGSASGSGVAPKAGFAATTAANGSTGGPSWQPTKQAVRIVGKSPLGSPALGPTGVGVCAAADKGKGREMLIPVSKLKKNGKAAVAATPAVGTLKRAVKGAKPPPVVSSETPAKPETKKTSHKAAEQKRRDSLKAGFDELRLLLPPINVELVDPDTGLPIAGASMPRLPARNLDTGEPNRNVSKVALLRCSNKHLTVLNGRIARRDEWIGRLVDNIRQLRAATGLEGSFDGDDQLFHYDVDAVDREDEFGPINGDDGMDEDDELSGLRRMSDEQEDGEGEGEGLEPVAEEGAEDEVEQLAAVVAPPPPPAAVALTRKKSLTKTAGGATVSRRPSTGRAAAGQGPGKQRMAGDAGPDGTHDMDES